MSRSQKGFTLIELMIVVVIIGILAAIAIPNFIAMQNRAKEGSTKANMHTLQLAAEDYGVTYDGVYAATIDATHIADRLPANFKNPFDASTGSGGAWEARATMAAGPTATPGLTSYCDSANNTYNIKGYGKTAALLLVLTSGQ
jgi:prepilin-type N-terminal cleavage/methylation domain-containing protein